MRRDVDLKEISDGRLYTANDMVKADCQGCVGCSACCRGMGESIVLDPYDVWRLTCGLKKSFEQLLADTVELHVVDGLVLPNLRMTGPEEACACLNAEGRCSIHAWRPGICRLFPLGRVYEGDGFHYFLQVHECRRKDRTKVKVRKWIDTPEIQKYEAFIRRWHAFLKEMQERVHSGDEEEAKTCSLFLLRQFYLMPYEEEDFYSQFEKRM